MSDAPAAHVTENGVSPVVQEDQDPGFKVFVGNLAYSTTDEGLKAFFAPVAADVISAQIIMRGPKSAGYGFVSMTSAEATQKAVEALDKNELDGRQIIVEVAKPADQKEKEKKEKRAKRRPGRRGSSKAVTGEVSEAEANGQAEKTDGAEDQAPPRPKKKKSKRKAKKPAAGDATDTPAVNGEADTEEAPRKQPRARRPRQPRPPRPAGEDPAGEPSKTMLFVANLGFNIDDIGLSDLFTEAGIDVVSARIVRRRWGQPRRSKGYGFVDVGSEEEQQKAIDALQGKEVGGRVIAVKVAVNTPHDEADAEPIATPPAVAGADATPVDAPAAA